MSYNQDHMAWQQRVMQEQIAAYSFLAQVKQSENQFLENNENEELQNNNRLIYYPYVLSPNSLRKSQRGFEFLDPTNHLKMNGLISQTPRQLDKYNKQTYTFGTTTNIKQSPLYEDKNQSKANQEQKEFNKNDFLSKKAYVKKQRSTSQLSSKSKTFKTYYPPNYDKQNHHMEKLPKIQRFNEQIDTYSLISKNQQNKQQQTIQYDTKSQKSQRSILDVISQQQMQNNIQEKKHSSSQQKLEPIVENKKEQEQQNQDQNLEQIEEKDEKSELYDEINSLYNLDNPEEDKKSIISQQLSKAKSNVSKKSLIIITNLEKQLEEERVKRKKLEEELESIKRVSQQLLYSQRSINQQ